MVGFNITTTLACDTVDEPNCHWPGLLIKRKRMVKKEKGNPVSRNKINEQKCTNFMSQEGKITTHTTGSAIAFLKLCVKVPSATIEIISTLWLIYLKAVKIF